MSPAKHGGQEIEQNLHQRSLTLNTAHPCLISAMGEIP